MLNITCLINSFRLGSKPGHVCLLRLFTGVGLDTAVFVFTGVDVLATEIFSGSESES